MHVRIDVEKNLTIGPSDEGRSVWIMVDMTRTPTGGVGGERYFIYADEGDTGPAKFAAYAKNGKLVKAFEWRVVAGRCKLQIIEPNGMSYPMEDRDDFCIDFTGQLRIQMG